MNEEKIMKLLTKEIERRLPRLGAQERVADPVVYAKFFTPDSSWTWFATEGQGWRGDFEFFGYVIGQDEERGYFLLSELERTTGRLGLHIERDKWFRPGPLSEVLRTFRGERGGREKASRH
jgi:hypothetical protein